jgi:hypothetical protein
MTAGGQVVGSAGVTGGVGGATGGIARGVREVGPLLGSLGRIGDPQSPFRRFSLSRWFNMTYALQERRVFLSEFAVNRVYGA